jgi:hypothetical protein
MKKIGVYNLSVKEIHLPLNSNQQTINAAWPNLKMPVLMFIPLVLFI